MELPGSRPLWKTGSGLFSDHYLKQHIAKNTWWPQNDEALLPVWEFCRALYQKRARWLAEKGNEQDCRQEFIDKVLTKLGFAWSDNLRLPSTSQDLEPDYILYASDAEKEKVLEQDRSARYAAGVSLLEAKKFGHPLAQISKHQQRYPHQQIRDYLAESQIVGWGILTNGREWRLYCRDTKASDFFEISFAVAIESLENFRYFVALFGPAAFIRDSSGKCRLDQLRASATATQAQLEADLRERIFGIVECLANGFAERPENKITDADLKLLYQNCLIYLYRLLFILYAEGRHLLPVDPPNRRYYKQLSLRRLLSALKNFSEFDSRTQTRLCREIRDLCRVINGADKKANDEFDVPRYNGGLFDPAKQPELERWEISDGALADVLRQLMFTPDKNAQKFIPLEAVDYSELSVQQLGSIYEGLLEHHFARSAEGRLVLLNDKAERKATGTYYTPGYIVNYIVEHTLSPLVAEIEARDPVKSALAASRKDNSFAQEILKLNICDPAMGSGHFLVEATIWLAENIVYHPTTQLGAQVKGDETREEAELAHWRRRAVEACIYGVDLNPLAVELAKLSLWLTTIASDQPLNFLDHHLRCGNSLIGARLDQLGKLPEKKKGAPGNSQQVTFTFGPDLKQAVASAIHEMSAIEGRASADVAAVKDKEKIWAEKILPTLQPYKTIADLWTSTFFGNKLDEETYVATAQKILAPLPKGGKKAKPDFQPLDTAITDRRFFHWELEFPEVFFAENGTPSQKPGFDAVIGNPPYLPNEAMDADERLFYPVFYPVALGKYDTSIVSVSRGVEILHYERRLGFIVPQTWQTGDNYVPFRDNFIKKIFGPELVLNLPFNVFPDAYVDTCIAIFARPAPEICRIFAYPKKEQIAEIELRQSDFQIMSLASILHDPHRRLVARTAFYSLISKFAGVPFVPLSVLTLACQGPVETFFEYSDAPDDEDYLPFRHVRCIAMN